MNKTKKGFTIIEVVLVLAIGGLIFLMVFVALPALQRSQRNNQRKRDADRIAAAIIEYQKHNNGKLPFRDKGTFDKGFVTRYIDQNCQYEKHFSGRYKDYFTGASYGAHAYTNCSDAATSPDGVPYAYAYSYGARDANPWYNSHEIATQSDGLMHLVNFAPNTQCGATENSIKYSEGKNNFVVVIYLEGGQFYCKDNT